MTIKELVEKAHKNARKHGFWEDWDRRCSSGLALQDDYNNAIATRLGIGIDLESEIEQKMEKNRKRGYKHGKAF